LLGIDHAMKGKGTCNLPHFQPEEPASGDASPEFISTIPRNAHLRT
jgi:hypothetical protein